MTLEKIEIPKKKEEEPEVNPEQNPAYYADAQTDGERDTPSGLTVAALEFQVASLLDDRDAEINWQGEPVVINRRGDWQKKRQTLLRIARSLFPERRNIEDILDHTIVDYGLWSWSSPRGFWKAFKRDVYDAVKSAYEKRRVWLKAPSTAGAPTLGAIDKQAVDAFQVEQSRTRQTNRLIAKLEAAEASPSESNRIVAAATRKALANLKYLEELDSKPNANLSWVVRAIKAQTGYSAAKVYRMMKDLRDVDSCAKKIQAS